jgi:hypothetical protein
LLGTPPSKLTVVVPHEVEEVPLIDSVVPWYVQVRVQPVPVTLDEQLEPFVASVPQRHSVVPPSLTVQHAELPDVVLDEHPSGTPSATTASTTSVHTCRMLSLTLAIARSSPEPPVYGTGSGVTPFCLAASHPSSTPVGPSFVFTILNSTRRFCSHAASLCPGSSGQNSP